MMEKFRDLLRDFGWLSPVDIVNLVSIARVKQYKKGEYFVRSGEKNYNLAFVLSGLMRSYCVDEKGDEHTMLFINEKKNAGSSQTILRDAPSIEDIVALENTWVAMIDHRKLEKLTKKSPALMQHYNKVLKEILAFTVDQVHFHLVLNPEERYVNFCKNYPKLEQRITQKELASYLGITHTSLSRLRSRLQKK